MMEQTVNPKVFTIRESFVPKGRWNEDAWRVEVMQFINGDLHALHRNIPADPATDPASIKAERKYVAELCADQLALCLASKSERVAAVPVVFADMPDVPPDQDYELVAQ